MKVETDERLAKIADIQDRLMAFDPEVAQSINRAVDGLIGMRQSVLSQSVAMSRMASYYTGKIDDLTEMSVKLAKSSEQIDMLTTAIGYASMLHAKENAGLERAMGATGFGKGEFSDDVYTSFLRYGANQDAYLRDAETALGSSRWPTYSDMLDPAVEAQVKRMREAAQRMAFGGISNVTGLQWFDASKRRIDQMKAIEEKIGKSLISIARAEVRTSTNLLLFVGVACLMIILVTAIFGYFQIQSVCRPLVRFVGGLQRIRDEDYDFEPSDTDRRDEIGDCARALSDVQSTLQAAASTQLENRFKGTAFARANTPMFIIDADFIVTYANDASIDQFAEKAELFRTEVPSFDPARVVGEKLYVFENKLSDQKKQMADFAGAPIKRDLLFSESRIGVEIAGIFDEDGAHLGNVVSWQDVSESRTNDSKLAVVDGSQAIIEYSPDSQIQFANKVFEEITGYRLDEIVGKRHSILVDPKNAKSDEYSELWRKLKSGEKVSGEVKRVDKSGKEFWFLASYNPVLDDDGVTFKVVEFATDITEEKIRRASIASQLKAIGQSQSVFEFDHEAQIISANDNFLDAMGLSEDAVVGKRYSLFMPVAVHQSPSFQSLWS